MSMKHTRFSNFATDGVLLESNGIVNVAISFFDVIKIIVMGLTISTTFKMIVIKLLLVLAMQQ